MRRESAVHGNMRCWLRVAKSDTSTEDDIFLQLGDEPRPVAVFSRGASFVPLKRTPAPSEQRRAAASAFRSSTLMISPS